MSDVDYQSVKEAAREAAERSGSIRDDVRNLTMEALSQGGLDLEKIKQVVSAVLDGASVGAEMRGVHIRETLSESMAGVDEAIAKSAQASKLALQEAAGHLKVFGKEDLKRALDDVMALEELFLEVTRTVAKESGEVISTTLNELITHAGNSGTAVGQQSREIVETLNRDLTESLRETVSARGDAVLKVTAHLSQAAAGFLEGFAETLDAKVANHRHSKRG